MTEPKSTGDSASVDEAINRVLAAEQIARDAITECRKQAQALLDEARERAHRIEESAEARISTITTLSNLGINRAIAGIEAQTISLTEKPALTDEQIKRLGQMIDLLINEMVGAAE
jgi:predicted  nucleic acid-binding Zn-ribbon protein